MNDLDTLLTSWNKATAELSWGVQRVFRNVFELAADGKTHLVFGRDYSNGNPCLVNTVGTMLTVGGGNGVPMAHFPDIVSLFDKINRELQKREVNEDGNLVSPLAADVFLHHFAPLKDEPVNQGSHSKVTHEAYVEMTDEQIAQDLVEMFQQAPAACEITFSDDLQYVEVSGEDGHTNE